MGCKLCDYVTHMLTTAMAMTSNKKKMPSLHTKDASLASKKDVKNINVSSRRHRVETQVALK